MQRGIWAKLAIGGLFALLALVTWSGQDRPFGNGDEVIYAQGVREMRASGEYAFVPWQGTLTVQRPSTPYLLSALSSGVAGENPRALRFPATLFSLAILVLVFALLWRGHARYETAASAVILCAGAPSFHLFSRSLLSDPMLCVGVTLALYGTWQAVSSGRGFGWAGLGLLIAGLAKSVAVAIPGLALAPWLLWAARTHKNWRGLGLAAGLSVCGLLPFFALGLSRFGTDFFSMHLAQNVIERGQGELPYGLPGGPLAYIKYLGAHDGWAALLFLLAPLALVIGWRRQDRLLALLGSFVVVGFVVLSIYGMRLPHYLLILYPAAAAACALLLAIACEHYQGRSPLVWAVPVVVSLALGLTGITQTPDEFFLPDPHAVALGKRAKEEKATPGPLYTLEWYAPSAAYYAERPWVMLSADKRVLAIVNSTNLVRNAKVARAIPPVPEAPYLVVGLEEVVRGHSPRAEIIERIEPFVLARVR